MTQIGKDQPKDELRSMEYWIGLISGKEPLGDTFWKGVFLPSLIVVPLSTLLAAVKILSLINGVILGLFAIYLLALARAVIIAKPVGDAGKGWNITGSLFALACAGIALWGAAFLLM